MSIPVEVPALPAAVEQQAAFAYLLTVGVDGAPHAVAVTPRVDATTVTIDAGARTCANAAARPAVTVLWPPLDAGGYTLLADGDATVSGSQVRVAVRHAMLHRPAPAATDCGSDCAPVSTPAGRAAR